MDYSMMNDTNNPSGNEARCCHRSISLVAVSSTTTTATETNQSQCETFAVEQTRTTLKGIVVEQQLSRGTQIAPPSSNMVITGAAVTGALKTFFSALANASTTAVNFDALSRRYSSSNELTAEDFDKIMEEIAAQFNTLTNENRRLDKALKRSTTIIGRLETANKNRTDQLVAIANQRDVRLDQLEKDRRADDLAHTAALLILAYEHKVEIARHQRYQGCFGCILRMYDHFVPPTNTQPTHITEARDTVTQHVAQKVERSNREHAIELARLDNIQSELTNKAVRLANENARLKRYQA